MQVMNGLTVDQLAAVVISRVITVDASRIIKHAMVLTTAVTSVTKRHAVVRHLHHISVKWDFAYPSQRGVMATATAQTTVTNFLDAIIHVQDMDPGGVLRSELASDGPEYVTPYKIAPMTVMKSTAHAAVMTSISVPMVDVSTDNGCVMESKIVLSEMMKHLVTLVGRISSGADEEHVSVQNSGVMV